MKFINFIKTKSFIKEHYVILLIFTILMNLWFYMNRTYTVTLKNGDVIGREISHEKYMVILDNENVGLQQMILEGTRETYFNGVGKEINFVFWVFYLFIASAFFSEYSRFSQKKVDGEQKQIDLF